MLNIRFRSELYQYLLEIAGKRDQKIPPFLVDVATTVRQYKQGDITQEQFLQFIDSL